jgi:hypothetical protein
VHSQVNRLFKEKLFFLTQRLREDAKKPHFFELIFLSTGASKCGLGFLCAFASLRNLCVKKISWAEVFGYAPVKN